MCMNVYQRFKPRIRVARRDIPVLKILHLSIAKPGQYISPFYSIQCYWKMGETKQARYQVLGDLFEDLQTLKPLHYKLSRKLTLWERVRDFFEIKQWSIYEGLHSFAAHHQATLYSLKGFRRDSGWRESVTAHMVIPKGTKYIYNHETGECVSMFLRFDGIV